MRELVNLLISYQFDRAQAAQLHTAVTAHS